MEEINSTPPEPLAAAAPLLFLPRLALESLHGMIEQKFRSFKIMQTNKF
jgi:hypothetical protein